MIYVFIPYYHEDTPEFKKSLESQTYKDYIVIRRNRRASKILWTKAVNDFWKETFRWCGTKDDDVICIMNNDIEFGERLFEIARDEVRGDRIYIPLGDQGYMDFRTKKFTEGGLAFFNTFIGHCFFMNIRDFQKSGGFCKLLPHALADIDFGLKMMEKSGFCVTYSINHPKHSHEPCSIWSWRNYNNPILWTIFLLKNYNRYTLKNILKAWYDAFR